MKRIFPFVLLFALLSACSKGDGEDDLIPVYDPDCYPHQNDSTGNNSTTHQNDSTKPQGNSNISYVFKGVWMVDDIMADTVEASYSFIHGSHSISFHAFPYKAILSKELPDIKVSKITYYPIFDGTLLSEEDNLFLLTIRTNGDNANCILADVAIPYFCIGNTIQMFYLELIESPLYGTFSLPFVVTKDDGTYTSVVLTIAPNASRAVVDPNGTSLSSIFTVTQIETIENGESKKKHLDPVMKLKFTSIERIK